MDQLAVEEEHVAGLHDHRRARRHRRHRHGDIGEALGRVGLAVQSSGQFWLPGTTCIQPFSSSQSSSAIHAAMQVPGCTRR